MSDFELEPREDSWEFVITVPLPNERQQPESTLPKQHRFRTLDVALAASIEPFRTEHDLTLDEVARAVGAASSSAVSQWESGIKVPSGVRKRRLIELLAGKRWKSVRAAAIDCEGMPPSWRRAVRWYRRASRETRNRQVMGELILTILKETRGLTVDQLRNAYRERDSGWSGTSTSMPAGTTWRLIEDAAYGLRWIEIVSGIAADPLRSLVRTLPTEVGG